MGAPAMGRALELELQEPGLPLSGEEGHLPWGVEQQGFEWTLQGK